MKARQGDRNTGSSVFRLDKSLRFRGLGDSPRVVFLVGTRQNGHLASSREKRINPFPRLLEKASARDETAKLLGPGITGDPSRQFLQTNSVTAREEHSPSVCRHRWAARHCTASIVSLIRFRIASTTPRRDIASFAVPPAATNHNEVTKHQAVAGSPSPTLLQIRIQIGFVVFAQEAKSGSRDVIRREAQMSKNLLARRRRPEALHADDRTLVARPAMPSYR